MRTLTRKTEDLHHVLEWKPRMTAEYSKNVSLLGLLYRESQYADRCDASSMVFIFT